MILRAGQVFGMTTGRRPPGDKDTWWWNDEVKDAIRAKKETNKKCDAAGRQEERDIYRQANKEAQKVVAISKAHAMDEVYKELETPEGERNIAGSAPEDFRAGENAEEWRDSVIVPIFKEKGDIQDCGNYRGIKMISHTMQILGRVIDRRLREETTIGEEQFGFMPGRGTTDAIFAARQVIEKHREKQKELHLMFIDL